MDTISRARRSRNMSRIRAVDTKPEIIVRRALTREGYRYRLHKRDLPGRPDIVFAGAKRAIFVNGCFWHQHTSKKCVDGRIPKSRLGYWAEKLKRNVQRDKANRSALRKLGWQVLVVWECQIDSEKSLTARLRDFLGAR